LAAIEISGKLGYIDHSGAFKIPRQFVAGTPFNNGIARVVTDGPCAYVDYDHFDPCMLMSPRSAPSTGSSPGSGRSSAEICRWRFIDKTGKKLFESEYEGSLGFNDDLAAVKVGDLWGFIDLKGQYVIRPSFRTVHSFSDGLALVANDKESGFIDKTGLLKIPAAFYKAEPFSEGLAVVGDSETGYIYIDQRGRQAIPQRFVVASRFFHGLAHVKISGPASPYTGGVFAYIDKTGNRVFTYDLSGRDAFRR
jgi:hypothetical protein